MTSEVEVDAKIEVRSIWGLSRSTSIQNFGLITFKVLTSEVEVEAESKIEVRSIWGLSKSTCIQNFGLLTSKITELWLF